MARSRSRRISRVVDRPRILAIGDVHGCARALARLLEEVAPRSHDLVVTLGDYVDYGPDSYAVIEHLRKLALQTQVVSILGNHEQMMLEARLAADDEPSEWMEYGGRTTLASYSVFGDAGKLVDVPDDHWRWIEACPPYHETAGHLFVHACVHPELPLAEQPAYLLRWEAVTPHREAHVSGKVVVCGHTSQTQGVPLDLGHTICIDTWVHGDGWLTCLDVERRFIWQANETGRTRAGTLDELSIDGY